MNALRWMRAGSVAKRCQRCERPIVEGEPYRLMTRMDWPYCQACAKEQLVEEPPADLPLVRSAKPMAAPPRQTAARFDLERVAGAVRANVLDWRAKQSGEREPGEDI